LPKGFVLEEIIIVVLGYGYDPSQRLLTLGREIPGDLFGDSVDLKSSWFFLFDLVLDRGCLGRSDLGGLRRFGFVFSGLSPCSGCRLKAISLAFEVFSFFLFAHYWFK
jgi:hypothetical protein